MHRRGGEGRGEKEPLCYVNPDLVYDYDVCRGEGRAERKGEDDTTEGVEICAFSEALETVFAPRLLNTNDSARGPVFFLLR